jgi:hypothetical protein
MRADHDLAIGHLAEGPRILAGHADRAVPLLGQPGVVQDQHALGRALRHQGLDTLLIEGRRSPGGIGEQMVQAFRRGPRDGRGERVTVFAREVGQPACERPLHFAFTASLTGLGLAFEGLMQSGVGEWLPIARTCDTALPAVAVFAYD